ncbi:hypothetical protein [Planktothrix agardhii]|jgi:hypothetical protein|uniref:Uncharacterized protein n=3 Tax=Planktothrix agardhii TaxID=1160 RepID=A0AAD1Q5B6_PLAAG|nr:hypothetical protein [Planktothrix agardhii]MCF3609756.1 hypothetical protein [Planktothrix agardhii 1033]MCB8751247.1 hypothetical protein [Planktothrix agardhii 1810]MCF3604060.1 hypothetical protein [Planktothrix agardhii 1804]MCF3618708.1 hypothetical protein [Planktothrix agardhii 1806]MDS1346365.1 hypothetical protein [Planktothrix agardhii NRERC-751]
MGLTYAEIELANAGEIYLAQRGYMTPENIKRKTVKALVDIGAYMLAINEQIKDELNLLKVDEVVKVNPI